MVIVCVPAQNIQHHADKLIEVDIDENLRNDPVKVPTLHVHGLRDFVFHLSVHQTETYFDAQSRRVLDVDYHHAMPWVRSEVQQLANDIRSLYRP